MGNKAYSALFITVQKAKNARMNLNGISTPTEIITIKKRFNFMILRGCSMAVNFDMRDGALHLIHDSDFSKIVWC